MARPGSVRRLISPQNSHGKHQLARKFPQQLCSAEAASEKIREYHFKSSPSDTLILIVLLTIQLVSRPEARHLGSKIDFSAIFLTKKLFAGYFCYFFASIDVPRRRTCYAHFLIGLIFTSLAKISAKRSFSRSSS
jgi:hypothetical protein